MGSVRLCGNFLEMIWYREMNRNLSDISKVMFPVLYTLLVGLET